MDLTYVTLIILAAMIFVLSAMVGYLYWQQTRMMQQLNSISFALSSHLSSLAPEVHEEVTEEVHDDVAEEDDRASVEDVQEVEIVTSPPLEATEPSEPDIDDIQSKTTKQLQELLTKKGIPFGKRESKVTLIELLKATA